MTDAPVKVRVGTPADFDQMMDFLRLMHAENGMAPLAEDRVVPILQCALARHRAVVGIIDGDDGDVAASVGLMVGRWWYSNSEHLEDMWTFVNEPYRRRPMARPLIEFAKIASVALELPLLMGVLSDVRSQAKVRLYERQLPFAGGLFLFRPEQATQEVARAA